MPTLVYPTFTVFGVYSAIISVEKKKQCIEKQCYTEINKEITEKCMLSSYQMDDTMTMDVRCLC